MRLSLLFSIPFWGGALNIVLSWRLGGAGIDPTLLPKRNQQRLRGHKREIEENPIENSYQCVRMRTNACKPVPPLFKHVSKSNIFAYAYAFRCVPVQNAFTMRSQCIQKPFATRSGMRKNVAFGWSPIFPHDSQNGGHFGVVRYDWVALLTECGGLRASGSGLERCTVVKKDIQ